MYEQVETSKENQSKAVANLVAQNKSSVKQGFGFVDNRSKVNWPLTQHAENKENTSLVDSRERVMQLYFDYSGYTFAKDQWATAEQNAIVFDQTLDRLTDPAKTYPNANYHATLQTNLEAKSRKACTTSVGEAFETNHWSQVPFTKDIQGPGGTAGGDLKFFANDGTLGGSAGEVKSSITNTTYHDGIHDAYKNKGNIMIYMYTNIYTDNEDYFIRYGNNYCLLDNQEDNWDDPVTGKTYTFKAKVINNNGKWRQYLYELI